MKRKLITAILSAALCLSSCSIYDDNTHETPKDLDDYTTCEHILDGVDEAYEKSYSKFTLPDKESLHIAQPDGIYDLTLEYVNSENDTAWKSEKVLELQKVFGTDYSENVDTSSGGAVLGDPDRACVGIGFSDPYAFWEWNSDTVCIFNQIDLDSIETITISPKSKTDMPQKLKEDIDKSVELASKVSEVMGEELRPLVYDAYIFKNSVGTGYGVEMQKAYKGVGILNMQYANMDNEDYSGDNAILNMAMQLYTYFDENNELLYYRSCDSYKAKSTQNIDDVVSFIGACNILEKELGDNCSYEFDDVVLMYEPRGKYIGDEFDGSQTVKCTPKWYFIKYCKDTDMGYQHSIRFFSVDCKTGSVEARW